LTPSGVSTEEDKAEGQAIIPPVLRQRPPLLYPEAARLQKLTGTVVLTAEVGIEGILERIVVFRSSGSPELDAAAREHVRQWRFSPARQAVNQKPVKVTTQIRVRFGGEGS
jgi:protein TonB